MTDTKHTPTSLTHRESAVIDYTVALSTRVAELEKALGALLSYAECPMPERFGTVTAVARAALAKAGS